MTDNLGETRLKRKKRMRDPMRTYDALPPALRTWLAEAALPWSPASCRRIWQRARERGEPVEAILARLDRAEALTLSKDIQVQAVTTRTQRHHHQDNRP
jgi:hypothetical protein